MNEDVTSKSLGGPSELVMIMPIRKGLVECPETRTYKSRLKTVAKTFDELRATNRESLLFRPYSDVVDRIRTIHSVHIAIIDSNNVVGPDEVVGPAGVVAPDDLVEPDNLAESDKVLLAVSFDQAWEPYIRVIWRDIGTLLDTILSNCEGYSGVHSTEQGFDAFASWVRKYQINTETFYLSDSLTIDDRRYLEAIEGFHREDANADLRAIKYRVRAVEDEAADVRRKHTDPNGVPAVELFKLGVKAATALHSLTYLYPKGSTDHRYLHRAAGSLLKEFDTNPLAAAANPAIQGLRTLFATELAWLDVAKQDNWRAPEPVLNPPAVGPADIQGGILDDYQANVGCLVFLQIRDAPGARRFLRDLSKEITTAEVERRVEGPFTNVAFTLSGLRGLLPDAHLRAFPKEFREGMEARAGLLGDLRTNHPDHWQHPVANWPLSEDQPQKIPRISLDNLDIVVQLRTKDDNGGGDKFSKDHVLVSRIKAVESLAGEDLRILGVEPMWRLPDGKEHFGFKDGISQPDVKINRNDDSPQEAIPLGAILLGQQGAKFKVQDRVARLLNNGTFLVVRKLRQHTDRLDTVTRTLVAKSALPGGWRTTGSTTAEETVRARLMGRWQDGKPLIHSPGPSANNNAFDYQGDQDGAQCPLQSHIRRSNPRALPVPGEPVSRTPRIMRRGMSYGPAVDAAAADADRGLIFQAYNASIAEQFEVIQRWISGGNSTGHYSQQSDPFLGLPPVSGQSRVLTMHDGNTPVRIDLGDQPLVSLQWGLYLFVPSMDGLGELTKPWAADKRELVRGKKLLRTIRTAAAQHAASTNAGRRLSNTVLERKRVLEERNALDDGDRPALWRAIRESFDGVERTEDGVVLVADAKLIEQVLNDKVNYSVCEYMTRLAASSGKVYLGLDRANAAEEKQYQDEAARPNAAIFEGYDAKQAFDAAYGIAAGSLGKLPKSPPVDAAGTTLPVDVPLLKYVDIVLAKISTHWFGVGDGNFIKSGGEPSLGDVTTAHCPYHVTAPSRYVFSPWDTAHVRQQGIHDGELLLTQVRGYAAATSVDKLTSLARKIRESSPRLPDDLFPNVLLGAMIGMLPTVSGNFLSSMRELIDTRKLWRMQADYFEAKRKGANDYDAAMQGVFQPLTEMMASRPVAELIYRTARSDTELGKAKVLARDLVVLGLGSASMQLLERGGDEAREMRDEIPRFLEPVFGGVFGASMHGCPGRKIAIGTLLGMICALLAAGTLRPTASNLQLLVYPN